MKDYIFYNLDLLYDYIDKLNEDKFVKLANDISLKLYGDKWILPISKRSEWIKKHKKDIVKWKKENKDDETAYIFTKWSVLDKDFAKTHKYFEDSEEFSGEFDRCDLIHRLLNK